MKKKDLNDANILNKEDLENLNEEILDDEYEDFYEEENSEVVESLDDEESIVVEDKKEKKKKDKTDKKSLKDRFLDKWNSFDKKKKIIFVASVTAVLFVIILSITLIIIKLNNKDDVKEKEVIIENNNYRYENGKLVFINDKGKDIGSYECQNKNEKTCFVAILSNEDNFDITKEIYEDKSPVLTRSSIYNDKYVFIYDNEKETDGTIKLYDFKDKKDLGTYKLIKAYESDEGYVIAKDESDKYGMLLLSSNEVKTNIDFTYDYLGIVDEKKEDSKVVVKSHGKWYLLTHNNQLATKGYDYEIKNYNDKYVSCINNKEYILYDYEGKRVFDTNYEYINFYDSNVVIINNDTLYVYDTDLNKLTDAAIILDNSNFNPVDTYSGDINKRKLESTAYSYKIEISNDTLNITYKVAGEEKKYSVNLLESKLNNKLQYLSYSNGILYIYQDLNKEVQLGSYKCESKNAITSETTALSNCTIATDSYVSNNIYNNNSSPALGYIPIYNNRFAFIYDNNKIVLYDLQNSKVLSTYGEVDTNTLTGSTNVSFITDDGAQIIARNNKGKYGVIKINKDSAKGLIGFNYSKLERFGSYYRGVTATNTEELLSTDGNALTGVISGNIIKYHDDYLVTKENSLYYVYSFEGKRVNNNGYKFIELYDSYYAVVDNTNKLNAYNYNDNGKKLFANDLDLLVTSFNNQENKSFNITYSSGIYYASILNSSGNTDRIIPSTTSSSSETTTDTNNNETEEVTE
ncbi:MAG: hypothetical protein IJ574_02600 [Bacilli bacterium]|nr:hypothetical protein [Bacilli bacterium]